MARGDACTSAAAVAARVNAIVRQTMRAEKLKAVLYSVRVRDRNVVTGAQGESMTGVPATTDCAFATARSRSRSRTSARWRCRCRGMGCSTSTRYRPFNTALYADPFRSWTPGEVIRLALARPPACAPGTCWSYSNANLVILGEIISRATGTRSRR